MTYKVTFLVADNCLSSVRNDFCFVLRRNKNNLWSIKPLIKKLHTYMHDVIMSDKRMCFKTTDSI